MNDSTQISPQKRVKTDNIIPMIPFQSPQNLSIDFGKITVELSRFSQRPGMDFCEASFQSKSPSGNPLWISSAFSHIGIVVAGSIDFKIPEQGHKTLNKGNWFIASFGDILPTFNTSPETHILWFDCDISILKGLVSSTDLLNHLNKACLSCPQRDEAFFLKGVIDSHTHSIAEQISKSPNILATERIHIESLSLEMLRIILQQPKLSQSPNTDPCLRHEDEDALVSAARILEENLTASHSIPGLSRKIFLNEFKLKKGFKQRFQTTVFGYLRQKRMERAYSLLKENTHTILEIAIMVGYTNPSHFARAFREQFGLNPKQIRANFHPKKQELSSTTESAL